ncbi:hypothetical protein ACFE04_016601 [Oxalis oulophora]
MSLKSRGLLPCSSRRLVSHKWTVFLCISCFCAGMLFTNRLWTVDEPKGIARRTTMEAENFKLVLEGCNPKSLQQKEVRRDSTETDGKVSKTQNSLQTLDETILTLESELAAARAAHQSISSGAPLSDDMKNRQLSRKRRYLMVVGINTAFSSRKRRDSVRSTWMPQGEKRKRLEEEKGIIIRFVIGHGATSGGILDRAVEAEGMMHGDILRLQRLEKLLLDTGRNHEGVRYHEPEYWKFGEAGNRYFRHATGQLYAISNDLATYISRNQHVLHKFANEDVSLGSWFIGLDVEHIDDRRLCCGTPPDCEWKAQAGNICVASFDWTCSGICNSANRIKEVHRRCGEGEKVLWSAKF